MRDAALEQYQTANKYDLGQCTVEFKNCMITTAECGEDFSGCASVAAFDSTNTRGRGENSKNYTIKGAATEIQIKASTYDILMSKKPLCDTVTKQCQLVADQVWDTFLREVAPQVKSAELIAEDNVRQNCISEISSCFQQACRDTIDPNDPEGSYDMCLTRPETMLSLCTVPLNACGIDSADPEKSNDASAMIWDFVLARLESMRINSCTTQVKECLQSPDRCGQDYTQCIGLDTDTIIRMCPQDLLVGCQNYDGGDTMILSGDAEDDFYARLEPYVQGIILDIDNNLLTECQNAADQAMISVCGDTENCDNITIDEYIGSNTLEYKICQISGNAENTTINYKNCYTDLSQISDTDLGLHDTNGNSVERKNFSIIIEGEIPWENVLLDDEGKISITDDYIDTDARQKIESELATLQNNINNAINAIESNPEVQFCTTGRIVQGLNDDFATKLSRAQAQSSANTARSVSDRTAQLSSLEVAAANQTVIDRTGNGGRFPGLTQQMRSIIATSAIKRAMDNYRTKYEELEERRMQDYVTLNERIAEVNNENLLEARRDAAMAACVGTAEATTLKDDPNYTELYVNLMLEGKNDTTGNTADNATATNATEQQDQYVGTDSDNKWNYRETVTSTFSPTTLVCHRCIRVQNCATPKKSRKFCKKWADPVETCKDIQF